MIVSVYLDARLDRTADGQVWTQTTLGHSFWTRYLDVFDGVRVVARLREVREPPPGSVRVDGPGVLFGPVPFFAGPWQYVAKAPLVRRAARSAVGPQDAVILRVGSQVANCVSPLLQRRGHPYAVEVIGDPWDVFAPGVVSHPLRPLLRRYFAGALRRQCRDACAASYVTQRTLQRRYPPRSGSFTTSFSSVRLLNGGIAPLSVGISDVELPEVNRSSPRDYARIGKRPFELILVGSLAQRYKGVDVALEAVSLCVQAGWDLRVTVLGDGKFRKSLECQAGQLGIASRVTFRGNVAAGEEVQKELDRADLFVMPSRTEGLPRAMIEAMSRGLPCIGSAVGGIPELLASEHLFPPADAQALAQKIQEVVGDPARLSRMSATNFERSADFREGVLRQRRRDFYTFVRWTTERWIAAQTAADQGTRLRRGRLENRVWSQPAQRLDLTTGQYAP